MRKEIDFVGDGAGEVGEGFADVGRVVVGFIAVLGCHAQELLMDGFESVDAFFELNVVGRKLGLDENVSISFPSEGDSDKAGEWESNNKGHTLSSAVPICSLKYCWVRAAKGVTEELIVSK